MERSGDRSQIGLRGFVSVVAKVVLLVVVVPYTASAGSGWRWRHKAPEPAVCPPGPTTGGEWYWMRSPEQEKRVTFANYNRYCLRCHGVDGRGVWDIPDVPDFANLRWQQTRSDAQLVRGILEGRGACMPPFRGTLTLEESWAMARYLRTFVPGTEQPRPDRQDPEKSMSPPAVPSTPGKPPSAGK